MTRTRYRVFESEFPYFLTNAIVAWLPVFAHPELAQFIFDSWRFLQGKWDIRIYGYVIMENHLHWIASGEQLSDKVKRFKSYTARKIIDALEESGYHTILEELRFFKMRHKSDQKYQLWQEGSHPKQIQNREMMHQKLEYMHNNPLRRGYVDDPVHWRYSSARNYTGISGMIDVITDW